MLLLNLKNLEKYASAIVYTKHRSSVVRLLLLLFRRAIIAAAKKRIERQSKCAVTVLCVYPDLAKPTFVAEYDSQAYHYLTTKMLPSASCGLRLVINNVTSIHPSLDTFVLVDEEKYAREKKYYFRKLYTPSALESLSMLEIKTSNPLAFSFSKNAVPSYVVRLGDKSDIILHEKKMALYESGLRCIPQPIGVFNGAEQSLIYERVARGESWFTVLEKIDLETVKSLSISGLMNFNNQIKKVCKPITINMRELAMDVAGQSIELHVSQCSETAHLQLTKKLFNSVDSLDETNVIVYPTHGDFCVNNLIFDDNKVNIVDLEDFGKFNFPYFDELALAVSLALLTAEHSGPSFTLQSVRREFNKIIDSYPKESEVLISFDALFSYFLLTRLDKWSDNPARQPYLKCLLELIR